MYLQCLFCFYKPHTACPKTWRLVLGDHGYRIYWRQCTLPILLIMLYGSECWTVKKAGIARTHVLVSEKDPWNSMPNLKKIKNGHVKYYLNSGWMRWKKLVINYAVVSYANRCTFHTKVWHVPRISLRRIMSSSSCLTRHHCSASILYQHHTSTMSSLTANNLALRYNLWLQSLTINWLINSKKSQLSSFNKKTYITETKQNAKVGLIYLQKNCNLHWKISPPKIQYSRLCWFLKMLPCQH